MNKDFLFKLCFNILETMIIYFIGVIFNLTFNLIIVLMLIYFFTRLLCGQPKHYNKWYRCFVWSTLIFTSIYAITDLPLMANILLTVFTGYIATGRADINDIYMWSGKASKYDALKDAVSLSPNNPIILEHEEYWRKNYPVRYDIFKFYFRENKTYTEIAELKGFDDNTITKRECSTIYSILEKPLSLPPIKKCP